MHEEPVNGAAQKRLIGDECYGMHLAKTWSLSDCHNAMSQMTVQCSEGHATFKLFQP